MSTTEPAPEAEWNQYAAFLGGPTLTIYCTGDNDLMLHDAYDSDDAWIAMQEACTLREWR